MNSKHYSTIAHILLQKGVSLSKGDILCITFPIESREFIYSFTQVAYELGAKYVEIHWDDPTLNQIRTKFSDTHYLSQPQPFLDTDTLKRYQSNVIWITFRPGVNPIDTGFEHRKKLFQHSITHSQKQSLQYKRENPIVSCSTVIPTYAWACTLFPDLDKDLAYQKLWDIYCSLLQCTQSNPLDFWEKHIQMISHRREKLNQLNLKELHFEDALSNFSVKLIDQSKWVGGCEYHSSGKRRLPNFPTEEIFTANHKYGINGIVYACKPLLFQNKKIDHFWFKFKNGKIIDYNAKEGLSHLEELLSLDPNNLYCGEIALLAGKTLVGNTNLTFQTTLLDENAASHMALGCAYPVNIDKKIGYNATEFEENNLNFSNYHIDFMFGREDTSVIGIDHNNRKITLINKGKWAI